MSLHDSPGLLFSFPKANCLKAILQKEVIILYINAKIIENVNSIKIIFSQFLCGHNCLIPKLYSPRRKWARITPSHSRGPSRFALVTKMYIEVPEREAEVTVDLALSLIKILWAFNQII